MILHTIETAAPIGALVIATIAALRARVPRLNGWLVLPVAAVLAIAICIFVVAPWVNPAAYAELTVCVWLVAIGVPAFASRVATHAATTRTIVVDKE